jgi:peptidoglycan/xylan/chitin deacetylase (PgdA/CDA1 family)
MGSNATRVMQLGLGTLYRTGLGALLAPMTRGKGVIFTLHSVCPEPPEAFEPNRILKVTPDFLETTVETVRKAGYDIVSLDEVARRLKSDDRAPPFASFTFDDGYKDNRDYAYPVLKKHGVPFAIYIPTDYPDGKGELWWLVLENAIRKANAIRVTLGGTDRIFETRSVAEKQRAFDDIYWFLRSRPESELRATVAKVAEAAGYDSSGLCRELIMSWDEIRALAQDPLVRIGAHTRRHYAVAKLPEAEARAEITESVERVEMELGRPCRHFSFPYGDAGSAGERDFAIAAALGLETAVTTHKDVLRARYRMTGLPRVSLNGDFQKAAYVSAMMTGAPFLAFDTAKAAVARLKSVCGQSAPAPDQSSEASATRPGAASI